MTPGGATFPKLLAQHAARHGDRRVALKEKRYGIWQTITWAEWERRVRLFAQGLASMGFRRGEPLAILGDNRPEWVISELAAQSLGGMSVGLYPDGVLEEVEHVIQHAQVRFVVAEDQEQVDKILALKDQLPKLRLMVYDDPRGMVHYKADWVKSFEEVQALGRKALALTGDATKTADMDRGGAQGLFLPGGPFAVLPMTDDPVHGHRSSIVWTERTHLVPAMMGLAGEALGDELHPRVGPPACGFSPRPESRMAISTALTPSRGVPKRLRYSGEAHAWKWSENSFRWIRSGWVGWRSRIATSASRMARSSSASLSFISSAMVG